MAEWVDADVGRSRKIIWRWSVRRLNFFTLLGLRQRSVSRGVAVTKVRICTVESGLETSLGSWLDWQNIIPGCATE
jgi:hypothetical protein